MATAARHRQICEMFLAHAQEQLDRGDFLQASEKAWGAVAHRVKAIARERHWPNRSHEDVRHNALQLLSQSSSPGANRQRFRSVERLHINFYEEMMGEGEVRMGVALARFLVEVLNSVDSRMAR